MSTAPEPNRKAIDIVHLPSNLRNLVRGLARGDVLVITEGGLPVAELRQVVSDDATQRLIGLCAGEFTVPDDFDDPLPGNILADWLASPKREESTPNAKEHVESHSRDSVTEALDKVYDDEPSNLDAVVAQMQWLSLPKEAW